MCVCVHMLKFRHLYSNHILHAELLPWQHPEHGVPQISHTECEETFYCIHLPPCHARGGEDRERSEQWLRLSQPCGTNSKEYLGPFSEVT